MLKVPLTTIVDGAETVVVAHVRGMHVRRDAAGAPVVELDDWDVELPNGELATADFLDDNETIGLAIEEAIEVVILHEPSRVAAVDAAAA